ncbi:MAG: hypothetical protein R6W86_12380 [Marinobacter sp.]|uniref:hypothetical protein n=1 Tax=Marinobacter sp. TaxID=50741 RepID=UPI00396E3D95
MLKDRQQWRAVDHQNPRMVYVVRSKPRNQVLDDELRSDFFEVVGSLEGGKAAQTLEQWQAERAAAGASRRICEKWPGFRYLKPPAYCGA